MKKEEFSLTGCSWEIKQVSPPHPHAGLVSTASGTHVCYVCVPSSSEGRGSDLLTAHIHQRETGQAVLEGIPQVKPQGDGAHDSQHQVSEKTTLVAVQVSRAVIGSRCEGDFPKRLF